MTSLTFLSFGNERFKKSRDRILAEAKALCNDGTPAFDAFVIETEDIENDPEFKDIIDNIPKKLGSGRGYWWYMWKPYVIYKTLKSLNDGDLLFYGDSGMTIYNKADTHKRINNLVSLVKNKEKCPTGIVTFITTGKPGDRQEFMYNLVDVFEHFGVLNNKDITHTQQCQAGVHMIMKCPKSVEIIELWYKKAVTTPSLFVGDRRIFKPNQTKQMDGFRDHRHDQSVWSIICKLNGVTVLPHNKNPMKQTHIRE